MRAFLSCRSYLRVLVTLISLLASNGFGDLTLVGVPTNVTIDCGAEVPGVPSVTATGSCVSAALFHWPMNDSAGTATITELISGNHATLTGAGGSNLATSARAVSGKILGAIHFNGTNDNAASAQVVGITGAVQRAISFWARTTQTVSGFFVSMGSDTNGKGFGAFLSSSGQLYFWGSNQDINSGVNVRDGLWHHVVVMYDGTNGIVWVDGVKRSQSARSLNTTPGPIHFASKPVGIERLSVDLDTISLYSRVLSSNDIALLYASGAGTETATLFSSQVAYSQVQTGSCPATITRTWAATDTCGSATSATQVITINAPPTLALLGVPGNTNIGCGDALPAVSVVATGGCGASWTGLVGQWGLNDADTNSVVADATTANPATFHASGGAQDLTINHSVSGHFLGALEFDRTSTWASTVGSLSLTGRMSRSLSFWMASTSTAHGFIVTAGADPVWPQGKGFGAYMSSAGRMVFWGSNQDFDSGVFVRNGAWHHVVVMYDGAMGWIYVDGQFAQKKTVYLDTSSAPLNFGSKPGGYEKFGGKIDNVILFDRVLSFAEIQSLYAAQLEEQGPGAIVQVSVASSNTCPGTVYRTWTATDTCGGAVSLTQTIFVAAPYGLGLVGVPANTSISCEAASVPPSVSVTGGCLPALNGLIGHWTMNDTTNTPVVVDRLGSYPGAFSSGTTAEDTSGHAVAGHSGGALRFDGSNDLVATTTIGPITGRTARSLSFWMRSISLHHGFMVTMGADPVLPRGRGFGAYMSAAGRVVFWGSNQDFDSGIFVRDGSWHHVAVVYDGLQGYAYVDGLFRAMLPVSLDTPAAPLVFGSKPHAAEYFEGDLDNVMLFDRALSSNDVAGLHAAVDENVGVGPGLQYAETMSGVCPRVLTRVWSASDGCGASAVASQIVTFVDASAPVLLNTPADLYVGCGAVPPPPTVTAEDSCEGSTSVQFGETTNDLGGGAIDIMRVWTSADSCGNGAGWTQAVHVTVSTAPTLVGVPGDVVVPCGELPVVPDVTASSCCSNSPGGVVPVSFGEISQGGCPALVRRVWTAVDGCGSSAAATQTITFADQGPPQLSVPRDYSVSCGSSIDPIITGTASSTDDCAAAVSITHIDNPVAPTGCPSQIQRTWRATDGCGQFTEGVQVITLQQSTEDSDGEGLTDVQETTLGTNPNLADTDGDGLTDWEEVTGQDDSSTPATPCGYVTNPLLWDTDGDAFSDGIECAQGTDPTLNEDFLSSVSVDHIQHDVIICWTSVSNLNYDIVTKTNLANPVFESVLATNIPATPPMNCYTVPVNQSHFNFIRVRIER